VSSGEPYQDFAAWLDERLAAAMPPAAIAFCLNLYEGNDTFVEEIAASTTDERVVRKAERPASHHRKPRPLFW